MYVLDKPRIYLYPLVFLDTLVLNFNGRECVCLCSYISQLPFRAYASKGIQFTKVYSLSSESLLYKFVIIYLSACNFVVICVYMYLYKEIKVKPKNEGLSYPTQFLKSRGSGIWNNSLEYRTKQINNVSRRNVFFILYSKTSTQLAYFLLL